jgi:putative sterol carrier protein
MDTETFMCVTCGRWNPQQALETGMVRIEGDDALGRAVVAQLNVMI